MPNPAESPHDFTSSKHGSLATAKKERMVARNGQ